MKTDKRQNLFIILAAIFLSNALLAELIGVKIFSGESTLSLPPANIPLLGDLVLDFNLTAGVIIWPVVFLTTDIINEYFGKKGVRRLSYIAAACIAYAFIVIFIITKLPPADFWLDVNSTDSQGNFFNINFAFNKIFSQGLGIIVGSLVAFLIGQFMDVFVFQKLKKITGHKMIWLRATGSTLISQLIDSFVVLAIAFYILAPEGSRWSIVQVISVGIINYIYKFTVAIVLTPLIYLGHYLIDNYLGSELSEQMTQEATETSEGFF
ncbi:queuosine precursor transporter [Marinoscillum sp. MHG1-6]|uniref:queuosine precursor transporter n=1 Tax=Marinoscillum sp. MHG1-6 TaxID=2959627 RepID=UPI0021581004|nr:queuosine precursor transporter [Marinoscillum sp. MHG1-6]